MTSDTNRHTHQVTVERNFSVTRLPTFRTAGTDWLLLSAVMTVPVDSPSAVARLTGSADISPAKHFSRESKIFGTGMAQDSLPVRLIDLPVSVRSSGHCRFKADRPTKLTSDEIKVLLSNFLQLHIRSSLLPKGKLPKKKLVPFPAANSPTRIGDADCPFPFSRPCHKSPFWTRISKRWAATGGRFMAGLYHGRTVKERQLGCFSFHLIAETLS
jgi:hypothetical protein